MRIVGGKGERNGRERNGRKFGVEFGSNIQACKLGFRQYSW